MYRSLQGTLSIWKSSVRAFLFEKLSLTWRDSAGRNSVPQILVFFAVLSWESPFLATFETSHLAVWWPGALDVAGKNVTDSKEDGICRHNETGSLDVSEPHLDKMKVHPLVLQGMLFWGVGWCGEVEQHLSSAHKEGFFFFSPLSFHACHQTQENTGLGAGPRQEQPCLCGSLGC